MIYEPKGRAREYSPLALNYYGGCDHDCSYCYVRRMRFLKDASRAKAIPKMDTPAKLRKQLEKKRIDDQVLLSFTGDPYCNAEAEVGLTRQVLEVLLEHQVPTAILTKGGMRCLRDFDLFRQFDQFKIGASLTFRRLKDSVKFEPGAAAPMEREAALRELSMSGIKTWVSFEPVIDPEQSLALLEMTCSYVDEFKLGKVNGMPGEEDIDWAAFVIEAVSMLRKAGKAFYVKKSLQPFAPEGFLKAAEIDSERLVLRREGCRV